ncbi:MAG: GNAT family N-acetyltransferase, partial [Gemmatimonadota bacterium]|nr:GNAT family N-acetyltransferase [Gemmatimonadota bacterium]
DDIIAFNIVHRSGVEGWMGPLSVRPDRQGLGLGKEIVRSGVEWLKAKRSAVIGLETMPRTMDNIGFYSSLGFVPGPLTITLTLDSAQSDLAPVLLSRVPPREKAGVMEECQSVVGAMSPGYDFTREIALTEQLALGDTVLLEREQRIVGYALCHTVPLVEGRVREETRVLKLVLERDEDLPLMSRTLADYARRAGTRRVAFRVQTEYVGAYQRLVTLGARVRWTDLRMAVAGYEEKRPKSGVVWSNWEI